MNNSAKIAIGVVAGVTIGAIAGILLAPAKGSDTRKSIINEGKDLADILAEKFTGIKKECGKCEKTETA